MTRYVSSWLRAISAGRPMNVSGAMQERRSRDVLNVQSLCKSSQGGSHWIEQQRRGALHTEELDEALEHLHLLNKWDRLRLLL